MRLKGKSARIAMALAGIGLAGLAVVWVQREPIARSVIDGELAARKVQGNYTITEIGTERQRLEKVVIGDPARPDLTADWVEIDVGSFLSGGRVKAIRASGVRLRGAIVDGKLSLGAVDRLLPAPTGEPFALPDIDVSLKDAEFALASPWGAIGAGIAGSGNLTSGFDGILALVAPRIEQPGCAGDNGRYAGKIGTNARKIILKGTATLAGLACGDLAINRAQVALDAALSESFNDWSGTADVQTGDARYANASVVRGSGKLRFDGTSKDTQGDLALSLGGLGMTEAYARSADLSGNFRIGMDAQSRAFAQASGTVSASGAFPSQAVVDPVRRLGASGSGTPVAPLLKALALATNGLARGSDLNAKFALDHQNGEGRIALSGINGTSRSGAKLAMSGEAPLTIRWPGGLALAGSGSLGGGGFPATRFRLDGTRGVAEVSPWSAGGSRLALSPVRFSWASGGLALDTQAVLDGPLGTGRIMGLSVPVSLRPGRSALSGCVPVRFQSLVLQPLQLSPASFQTCLSAASATIRAPRLSGRLGSNPVTLAGDQAQFRFANGAFAVDALAVRLTQDGEASRLDADRLTGNLQTGGASGRFTGLSGQLARVPVQMDQGSGDWSFRNSILTASAALRVSDAVPEPRYFPLSVPDMAFRLADGRIIASGTARHPKSGIAVSSISIAHDLGKGTGHAVLDVPNLTFGQALQPEELTPITLGVIAEVMGSVSGQGSINWTPDGVKSTGTFRTTGLDMAAAFGPVTGLAGEIALSDLLGMETATPQRVTIAGINPGISVLNGEISYRLLPGLKAAIDGGRWPFAGGFLILEPTVLDLNQAAERRMTFRVEGIDAARFIAAMEFENIAATGLFDGTLPMIFDKNGGRIEGGKLVARDIGTLSYVGELSNESMNAWGQFAFDALKSIKYDRLSIELDGAIDGDVITRISFAGVNQLPLGGGRTKLPIPVKVVGIDNLPFIFNITITAKFRQLFEMARSFNDPSVLINRMIPRLEPVQPPAKSPAPPVQPLESTPTP